MKQQSLKKQTAVTTCCNVMIRGLGFVLRVVTSRLLGPEALGVMELAGQAHMLALTPAAGLPGAVSRMAAEGEEKEKVLRAALRTALRLGLWLGAGLMLLSPLLARWMGEERVLPSLVVFSPCILLIGLSGAYRGYSLGLGNAWPPALCELTEQLVRLGCVLCMAWLASRLTVAWRAALPAAATVLGEGAGLALMAVWFSAGGREATGALQKKLLRWAAPMTLNRLSHTLLRMLCSVMIPLRLCGAGLSHQEAISRMGMLTGMVMPLLFLPGMFSGALGTVSIPAVAKCKSLARQRLLTLRLLAVAAAVGIACSSVLHGLAPVIAVRVYRLPEVGPLLQAMCPLAVMLPVQQVLSGVMVGMGLQRKSLYASLLGAGATLVLTYIWAGDLRFGIYGAGYASIIGHLVQLLGSLISFLMYRREAE